jgi:hypothetical protein
MKGGMYVSRLTGVIADFLNGATSTGRTNLHSTGDQLWSAGVLIGKMDNGVVILPDLAGEDRTPKRHQRMLADVCTSQRVSLQYEDRKDEHNGK